MKLKTLFFVPAIMFIISVLAFAGQNQYMGAEDIDLDGGKKGNIAFPHHVHQNAVGDCKVCHSSFPMKPDIIKELKAQGSLKKLKVMNKVCLKCHKAMKKEGIKTGPVSCSKCHVK